MDRTAEPWEFRSLLDDSGLCVIVLDGSLRIRDVNANFEHGFGWRAATLRGREILHVVHSSAHPRLGRRLARLATGALTSVCESVLAARPDSDPVPAVLIATRVPAHPGRVGHVVLVLHPAPVGRSAPREPRTWRGHWVLSELEARILECIAAGMSSAETAATLYLSRPGVEYHVKAMLRKLDAPNRTALVSRAYSLGLLATSVWPPKVEPEYVRSADP
ncbi:helix-turn-helix transcriptional regulator [Kibdelosporangium persicum]|uniref:helix-turn-helix transcriptional regulator n=1 Tax=Kibdelosporangium persicum TaxID=2698649 RepID=UPI0028B0CD89|nr:LuxR C-terminal-related transcriptional regulator [Kibdelosporangium persicum]